MPFDKFSFSIQTIVFNKNYIRSTPGILKCLECLIGFISFMIIWLISRKNYDPYNGTYSGFIGGDVETFALLFYFQTFYMTTLILVIYYFSIITSTIISKTVFEFVYNVLSSFTLFILSMNFFIILLSRNSVQDGFPVEPAFAGKLTSSIFGLINSLVFGLDACFAYKSYIHS